MSIRNRDECSIRGPNTGGAQPDLLHGACPVSETACIADQDRTIANDGHATEEVFNGLLGSQCDGQATDADSRENMAFL